MRPLYVNKYMNLLLSWIEFLIREKYINSYKKRYRINLRSSYDKQNKTKLVNQLITLEYFNSEIKLQKYVSLCLEFTLTLCRRIKVADFMFENEGHYVLNEQICQKHTIFYYFTYCADNHEHS